MKIILGFLGAVIGAAAGILYLAPMVSNWAQSTQTFSSPDEAMNLHNMVYLATGFLVLVFGWFLGLGIGGIIERSRTRRSE